MFLNRLKGRVREYIKVNISHHYVAGPVVAGVIERNDKQKSEINYEDKETCLIDVQDLKDVMNIHERYKLYLLNNATFHQAINDSFYKLIK